MGSASDPAVGGAIRPPRRIAILGFADTVHDAPFSDPSWEMWGMNGLWRVLKEIPASRFAAWFEIHTPDYIRKHEQASNIGTQQSDWLKTQQPFPIFMQQHYPEYPSSVEFPIEEMVRDLGHDYFTSSVALEIAYALMLPDVSEIGLWGIDLVHGTEWGDQRPCAEFWLGRAEGKGIKVTVHEKSALLKQRGRYGYEGQSQLMNDLREYLMKQAEVTQAKLAELRATNEKTVAEMQANDGAAQLLRNVYERLDIWSRGGQA